MKISARGLDCEIGFSKPDYEGWMRTSIVLRVPSFNGSFYCAVKIHEWRQIVDCLRKFKSSGGKESEAFWNNMEDNIAFGLKLTKLGSLEGDYKFSPENFSLGPTLSGTFEADQTLLQSWLQAAEQVVENAL